MNQPVQLFTGQGRLRLWQMGMVESLFGGLLWMLANPFLLELILAVLIVPDTVAVGWTEFVARAPLPVMSSRGSIIEEANASGVLRLCQCRRRGLCIPSPAVQRNLLSNFRNAVFEVIAVDTAWPRGRPLQGLQA